MSKENIEMHERVKGLEVNMENLDCKVDKIMTNHLPHIERKLWWLIGIIITGLVSILIKLSI